MKGRKKHFGKRTAGGNTERQEIVVRNAWPMCPMLYSELTFALLSLWLRANSNKKSENVFINNRNWTDSWKGRPFFDLEYFVCCSQTDMRSNDGGLLRILEFSTSSKKDFFTVFFWFESYSKRKKKSANLLCDDICASNKFAQFEK